MPSQINLKSRNTGLDFIRILAMLGIIILHVLGPGGFLAVGQLRTPGYWLSWALEIFAYCSVDVFGLLSGYLSCEKRKFSSYRIIELLVTVVFYCLVITAAFWLFGKAYVTNSQTWIKALSPHLIEPYWYIICYIALFFLMPYLNLLIDKLTDKSFNKLCLILVLLFSVLPGVFLMDIFHFDNGYSISWLIVCYFIGAYMKKSEKKIFEGHELTVFFISSFIVLLIQAFTYFVLGDKIHEIVYYKTVNYLFPLILLNAIMLVQFFARINLNRTAPKIREVVVALSTVTFDVYLIHCHTLLFHNILTGSFTWLKDQSALLVPVITISASLAIYIACALVGKLRKILFSMLRLNKLFTLIAAKINKSLGWTDF